MRILLAILICLSFQATAQKILQEKHPYMSYGGELIFSFSDVGGGPVKSVPRLSGAIHWQALLNINISRHLGIYSGLAIRNVGLIYKRPDTLFSNQEVKYKQRSYTLGVPFAIKLGNMNKKNFLYAGAEMEYAFAYKQKILYDKHKDVYSDWFGKQVNIWQPSLFAGLQVKKGLNIKFKYYLNNFLNKDYSVVQNGQHVKPFANLNSRIWYISISTIMSRKKKSKLVPKEKKQEGIFTKI